MTTVEVHGLPVEFPHVPYGVQVHYMSKVIEALQRGQHALLESPTGTGKTLSLLCSTLAWREAQVALVQAAERLKSASGETKKELEARVSDLAAQTGDVRYSMGDGEAAMAAVKFKSQLGSGNEAAGIRVGSNTYTYREGAAEDVKAGGGAVRASGSGRAAASEASRHREDGKRSRFPVIVYASRTHSQLTQVVRELRKTVYRPRVTVLGSRQQTCVHPQVSKAHGQAQNAMCRSLCQSQTCGYRLGLTMRLRKTTDPDNILGRTAEDVAEGPLDIEETVHRARAERVCPFYLAREPAVLATTDMVFVPYSYLIDPASRRALTLEWRDVVLVIDEAHNLESWCTEAMSFDLDAATLASCIAEVKRFIDFLNAGGVVQGLDEGKLLILQAVLMKLEDEIAAVSLPKRSPDGAKFTTLDASFVHDVLAQMNVTIDTAGPILDVVDRVIDGRFAPALSGADPGASAIASHLSKTTSPLEIMAKLLKTVFRGSAEDVEETKDLYRVHIREERVQARGTPGLNFAGAEGRKERPRTMSFLCMSPGIAMQELAGLGVRSVILTSGTLNPLGAVAQEMRVPFPVQCENDHVIDEEQVMIRVVGSGPSGVTLNSSYQNRSNPRYQRELGLLVARVAACTPDGLLVFFPSYGVMKGCASMWQETGVWDQITREKPIVQEPTGSQAEFLAARDQFDRLVEARARGAIFFAVCRGKVSEGVDFADFRARCVIVTGLPFPPARDPKIELKRQFLDTVRAKAPPGNKSQWLTGQVWYGQRASRAVNQAIGRVIRHRYDYGAILLVDERFGAARNRSELSKWIRPRVQTTSSFDECLRDLTGFYRSAQSHVTQCMTGEAESAPTIQRVMNIGGFRVLASTRKPPSASAASDPVEGSVESDAAAGGRVELSYEDGGGVDSLGSGAYRRRAELAETARKRVGAAKSRGSLATAIAGPLTASTVAKRAAINPESRAPRESSVQDWAKQRRLAAALQAGLTSVMADSSRQPPPSKPSAVSARLGSQALVTRREDAEAAAISKFERAHASRKRARPRGPESAPAKASKPPSSFVRPGLEALPSGSKCLVELLNRCARVPDVGEHVGGLLRRGIRALRGIRGEVAPEAGSELERELLDTLLSAIFVLDEHDPGAAGPTASAVEAASVLDLLRAVVGAKARPQLDEIARQKATGEPAGSPKRPRPVAPAADQSRESVPSARKKLAPAHEFLAKMRSALTADANAAVIRELKLLKSLKPNGTDGGGNEGVGTGDREADRTSCMERVVALLGSAKEGSKLAEGLEPYLPEDYRAEFAGLRRRLGRAPAEKERGNGRAGAGGGESGSVEDEEELLASLPATFARRDLLTGQPLSRTRLLAAARGIRAGAVAQARIARASAQGQVLQKQEAEAILGTIRCTAERGTAAGGATSSDCFVCMGGAQTEDGDAVSLEAPCGHAMCAGCWRNWMLRRIECPFCRRRVRAKMLRPAKEHGR